MLQPMTQRRHRPDELPLDGRRRAPVPPGMRAYLAILRVDEGPGPASSSAGGRAEIVHEGLGRSAAFRQELLSWIKKTRHAAHVAWIGEPNALPMLDIVCTPEVARLLRTLPDVEAVV